MKYTHFFFAVLIGLSVSCKNSSDSTLKGAGAEFFGAENTSGWSSVETQSFKNKGECSLDANGETITYQRIDFSYPGKDYCINDPAHDPEAPNHCNAIQVYEIDFSEESPALVLKLKGDIC